ncbi:MAG: hypothetical protein SNJ77_10945, partial [Cytophagales bacterium]
MQFFRLCFFLLGLFLVFSQNLHSQSFKLELGIDTNWFESDKNFITVGGIKKTYFNTRISNPVVYVKISCHESQFNFNELEDLKILQSADFEVIDSFSVIEKNYVGKIRFKDLIISDFLSIQMEIKKKQQNRKKEIFELQPILETFVSVKLESEEAFVG